MSSIRTLIAVFLSALVAVTVAQDGVSSASASRTRYLGELGIIPSSSEIAVEEIVNYHRHNIGRPKAGEAVHMDVRWGNDKISREGILQVGFATALAHDKQHLRPINLSLVIDKSGSMSAADKMSRVKTALQTFVTQLRPTDTLSITVFDSEASVLLPAQKVGEVSRIKQLIASIEPGSSTNIHGGLMLGYKEALRAFDRESTNRVVLLTDGIANVGVTEPAAIGKDSMGYNDRGIDLSTIGVGLDLNKDLLRELAKSGRGLFHFVADAADIKKVFVDEMQSLVSPVATDPNLEVRLGEGLELLSVYGYDAKIGKNIAKVKLDNMNSGMTQVVLLRVKSHGDGPIDANVRFSYYDLEKRKPVVKTEKTQITAAMTRAVVLADPEVRKNATIAMLAQSFKDMAAACEMNDFWKAEAAVTASLTMAQSHYPGLEDPDIKRNVEIARQYRDVLRRKNGQGEIRDEPLRGGRGSELPRSRLNLIPNGDFSQGNTGFTSAYDYIPPAYNCLWPAGYTIAPSFTQPAHLHRLITANPYASPLRETGKEQVMYFNAGGTDSMIMWTATVKCEPNTMYRVSFQGINLTAGQEWIPTYEIQVNGVGSHAQQPGAGVFAEISRTWHSGKARTATISIMKLPKAHNTGIVGIAAIKMVKE